tara:strand:+ start:3689 stop:5959 length:2271 start_codon:yes stop_codon:yes gene_type:complete
MKKTSFLIALCYVIFLVRCTSSNDDKTSDENIDSSIDQRVEKILSTLTLEDKCGEMTQLNLDMICVGQPYNLEKPNKLDSAKLRKVLVDLKVGSILNQGGQAYSREKWFELINEIQRVATQEKKSKIPVLYGIDAIHGVNYTTGNSLFPQQIGLAATWNTNLAYQMGCISAYETRASNIPWTFSPVLDLARDARWPRHWETFGEDPLLASDMGESVIKGYEGDDVSSPYHVASCLKHFLGYSVTLTGKDRTQAWVPERQMREYFLPSFKRAIDAGAKTLMVNSGEMNGIPVHANPEILTTLLRDELGFDGLVVTDWEDIKYLRDRHRVAKDYKEAIKLAIDAGIDMSMVPVDYKFPVLLRELVEEGEIKESRLDKSVRRILKLKIQLGLFENPVMNFDDYPDFGSEKHANAALNTARESITLLKNDDQSLPLGKERILLAGPLTNNLNALIGGWGRTWQGVNPSYNNPTKQTIFQAFLESDKLEVVHHETSLNPDFKEIYNALLKTKGIKTAVICIGEMPYTETVGDIEDMNLPEGQYELVKQISEAVDNLIIVLVEGRPRIISQIEPLADAIVQAYLPGNEGAEAIMEIITGVINPSGKLPYTYPRYASSHSTYDHKTTDLIDPKFGFNAFQPQYEFGHGLSYTEFIYSNLSISSDSISCGDSLTVSADVKNIGGLAGKEVVQLYVRDEVASITPAVKMLKGYSKIDLAAGETRRVEFSLTCKDLEFVGIEMERISESGDFTLMLDTLRMPFYLK